MHNMNRSRTDWEYGFSPEYGAGEYLEAPYQGEAGPYETAPEFGVGEYGQEMYEGEGVQYGEWSGEWGLESESPFTEMEEMELASELLEVTTEQELEEFLGRLISRAARGIGGFFRSSIGRRIGGWLRGAARTALPWIGRAVGTVFGGPVGTMVGGAGAQALGRAFGLELEGLSAEDQEFEVARQFVRLGGAMTRQAVANANTMPPPAALDQAVQIATQRYAPGLVGYGGQTAGMPMPPTRMGSRRRRGMWMRRGPHIILFGAG